MGITLAAIALNNSTTGEFIYEGGTDLDELRMELRDAPGGWTISAPGLVKFLIETTQGNAKQYYDKEIIYNFSIGAGRFHADDRIWHDGSNPGTMSYMEHNPKNQTSWAVVFNKRHLSFSWDKFRLTFNKIIKDIAWDDKDLFKDISP